MRFTDKQKTKLLIVGFTGAVLMVVVLYFHFIIGRGQTRDFKMRTATLVQEVSQARTDLREITGLMAQQDELDRQKALIEQVVQRLPSSPDAPGFFYALVTILKTTGIIQELLQPDLLQNRSQYTEIPYSIEAHGRYHELGQFLTLIEQNPDRFMRVKTFNVQNQLDRPSIHPIKMEIATFMFTN